MKKMNNEDTVNSSTNTGDSMEFILPGWMQPVEGGRRLQLMGQRCRACGIYFFPRTKSCKACNSIELEEALLGPEAELYSVTTDRIGFPLGRQHLVGQVRFEQGAYVQGFVAADVENQPAIGSRVELVPFEVPSPSGEGMLITYGFQPKQRKEAIDA
jgi:uncharacterized OB-fold protein